MMEDKITLPSVYLGNIQYYKLLIAYKTLIIESKEHFVKQSYRNRCEIFGTNGKLDLIIPIEKWRNHTPIEDIEISYASDWQKLHWRSIESAYRSSPFFEFYEDDFKSIYETEKYHKLLDFNLALLKLTLNLLRVELQISFSKEYDKEAQNQSGFISKPHILTPNFPEYMQVFSSKFNFIGNLSIIDLLFNSGPESYTYLKSFDLK